MSVTQLFPAYPDIPKALLRRSGISLSDAELAWFQRGSGTGARLQATALALEVNYGLTRADAVAQVADAAHCAGMPIGAADVDSLWELGAGDLLAALTCTRSSVRHVVG